MPAGSRLDLQTRLPREAIERLRRDACSDIGIEASQLLNRSNPNRVQPLDLIVPESGDQAEMVVVSPLSLAMRGVAADVTMPNGYGIRFATRDERALEAAAHGAVVRQEVGR